MDIFKVFTLDVAHRLPNVPEGHKCSRLHGRSFRVEIHLNCELGTDTGWVIDFSDVKMAFQPIYGQLDHQYLNDIADLENPTSEQLSVSIWDRGIWRLFGRVPRRPSMIAFAHSSRCESISMAACMDVSTVGRQPLEFWRSSALVLVPQLSLDRVVSMACRGHAVVRDVTPALDEQVSNARTKSNIRYHARNGNSKLRPLAQLEPR